MLTSTSLSGWNIRPCLCARDWVTSTIRCVSCRHPVSLFTHVMADGWVSVKTSFRSLIRHLNLGQVQKYSVQFQATHSLGESLHVFLVPSFRLLKLAWLSVLTCIHTNILQFPVGGNFWRLDKVILSKQDIVNEYWKTFMCTFLKAIWFLHEREDNKYDNFACLPTLLGSNVTPSLPWKHT